MAAPAKGKWVNGVRINGPVAPGPEPTPQPWVAPPPPAGTYDPGRDVEVEAAERGSGQALQKIATERARTASDYTQNVGAINKRQGYEKEDYEKAGERLKEAFQRLAGRQGEQANSAGVLSGGALLASAAKRTANEGLQRSAQTTTYGRQQEADTEALAALARDAAPPDATNPLGGRAYQDFATNEGNINANTAAYALGQHTLRGDEAGRNGAEPEQRPWVHTSAGSYRVGGQF